MGRLENGVNSGSPGRCSVDRALARLVEEVVAEKRDVPDLSIDWLKDPERIRPTRHAMILP